MQELVAAHGGGFAGHEGHGALGNDAHVTEHIRVGVVSKVVLVQTFQHWSDNVRVNVGNHMLEALGGVVDQHRQAGGGPPGARDVLAGHVTRDA